MLQVIDNLLKEIFDNHLMPFLWMHGEAEGTIRKYIAQIDAAGIGAVCLESRPHPDYLGAGWWRDVGIVLDECRRRGMKVWFFDDQHFPTGYAGGALKRPENQPLRKTFLAESQLDFVGPQQDTAITISRAAGNRPRIVSVGMEADVEASTTNVDNHMLAVLASRKTGYHNIDASTTIDVTAQVQEGILYWNIPEGEWTITVLYDTQDGGEAATSGYLNPLVPEATDLLLENVYNAHYRHFHVEFGQTIAGFFSDEPRFGNVKGPDARIGQKNMVLPWCAGLLEQLAKAAGMTSGELLVQLPLLFYGEDTLEAHRLRYTYMNVVSRLYSQHFSKRIGDWCREHGVQYIGHVIEDNNAHARLGYGAGHFFRSMAGQDMAGIDVVLHQLMPQQNNGYFNAMTSTGWDGEFFHYALAEMGGSLGRLDPLKAGQTMCEIFGAYGWAEDVTFMKWLADHMLVRGVNNFVLHAFTMKPFPDPDCPPHLYADGHNPQFAGLPLLTGYMNRVATLFSNGHHAAQVAVLYHGEAEWAGQAMLTQKVTRQLVEAQVGFEVVPADWVEQAQQSEDGTFRINQTDFSVLLVPFGERLPRTLLETLCTLARIGAQVIFVDGIPGAFSDQSAGASEVEILTQQGQVMALSQLQSAVKALSVDQLRTDHPMPWLRYFHYQRHNGDIYMFFNESTIESLSFTIPTNDQLYMYDPMTNRSTPWPCVQGVVQVSLEPAATLILYAQGERLTERASNNLAMPPQIPPTGHTLAAGPWQITLSGVGLAADTPRELTCSSLPKPGHADAYRDFAGTITYRTAIELSTQDHILHLANATGMIEVRLNDQTLGTRIAAPYSFVLPSKIQAKNNLEIIWTSNLAYNQRDYLSQYMLLKPLGFQGRISLT